jgi:C4-dicarboxylate-specific signal transduction histidine kinase
MSRDSIYILDDQEIDLVVMKFTLLSSFPDYEIQTFQVADEVMAQIKSNKPELIISDWNMPEISGIEFAQMLQKSEETRHIPLILCTGISVNPDNLKEAFDAGAVDFIRKPYESTELICRVKNHIELKKTRDKLQNNFVELTQETKLRIEAENELKKKNKELFEFNQLLEIRIQGELEKITVQQSMLVQKSKLESLGVLAAGIAHEINQPLTALSMGLENLLAKYKSGKLEEAYFYRKLDCFFEDVGRIRHIIDHIRTFSREQKNDFFEKVDVNRTIKKALSMLSSQYENHHINISANLHENLPFTLGNSYKLEQVVINLLTNAKDALEAKERMSFHPEWPKQIQISTQSVDNQIIITVRDNGIGIKAEYLEQIFDPFYTTKAAEQGTGLGLSISYGIVKDMKGNLFAESMESEWTQMTIILPGFN